MTMVTAGRKCNGHELWGFVGFSIIVAENRVSAPLAHPIAVVCGNGDVTIVRVLEVLN